ncbi:hypothetical protein [Desulfosarcina sp.]|uniref:baeRF7 domain-containing protein n=1 Tax=Desulfosarcina sp. TaxID=2027861 RepID=UPI003970E16A
MKQFKFQDLQQLMSVNEKVCISIYMPTDPGAAANSEQRIRFKNMLRRAEQAGRERDPKSKTFVEMIAKGKRLLEDDNFWGTQSHGLAVFIAPGIFWFYRLPITFEEAFSVLNRFVIKPLMPLFMAAGRFNILALSQSAIRLFSCTRHHVTEIELVGVPDGIDESLQYDQKDTQLQFHTGTPGGGGGRRAAIFHGQSAGTDDHKDEIRRYFLDVDKGLSAMLSEPEVPLVLAGVDYLLPIFQEVTAYQWVMPDVITGNPDTLRAEELHEKAFKIVRPALEQQQREAEARYHEMAGQGYTASGVRAVLPAAAYGRVEALFVALDQQRPGVFDRDANEVRVAESRPESSEDLLDLAVVETIRCGGKVYAVDSQRMPDANAAAAALLRY